MTRDTAALCALWREVHNNPAWLSLLAERLNLVTDDESCLIELDNAYLLDMKLIERQWRMELRSLFLFPGVDSEWAKGRRQEYLAQEINAQGNIGDEHEAENECSDHGAESPANQELGQRKSRHNHELSALPQNPGYAPESQIEGSAVLWKTLSARRGMMLCPLHDDTHPSMLVKNGFGYCFSCCGYLDSIGYLMRVRGLNFREAVKNLQGR